LKKFITECNKTVKSIAIKALVLILAVHFNSGIGIGIGIGNNLLP